MTILGIDEIDSVAGLVYFLDRQLDLDYPDISGQILPLLTRVRYENQLLPLRDINRLADGLGFADDPRRPIEILLSTAAESVAMAFSYEGLPGAEIAVQEIVDHWATVVPALIGPIGPRQRLSALAD